MAGPANKTLEIRLAEYNEKIAVAIEASHKPQKMETDPSAEWHWGCHHGDCFHFEDAALVRSMKP